MSYAAHEPYCTTSDLSSAIDLIEHLPQYGVPPDVVAQLQAAVRGFALLYLDIDGFKHFNDDLGHQAGDAVLYELAQRLLESVRPTDVVARISGDEFVVLADTGSQPEAAERMAQRIQLAMQQPMHIAERALQVPVSIGITPGHRHYRNIDQMLHDADVALCQAKQGAEGSQRCALFSRFSADAAA